MNKRNIALFLLAAALATSCNKNGNRRPKNIIDERFVHKYGLEIEQKEWQARGNSGKVITKLDDGTELTQTYKHGELDGITTYTFPHSDTIETVETYVNGQLISRVTNNELGRPQREIEFSPDGFEVVTSWYEGGVPQSREMFKKKRLIEAEYFSPNNQIESKIDNGEGIKIARNIYGDLISKDYYEAGMIAERTTFHKNGTPHTITPYANGKPHGEKKVFLPAGEPEKVENWVNGVQHGTTTLYKNGEKFAELPYVNGKIHGTERHFRDETQPVEEIAWKEGVKHGPSKTYVEGEETKTIWFHKGKPVTKSIYNQNNK